jgi:hypothetical protein
MLGLGIGVVAKLAWDALNNRGPGPLPPSWLTDDPLTVMFDAPRSVRFTGGWDASGQQNYCGGNQDSVSYTGGPGAFSVSRFSVWGVRVTKTGSYTYTGGCSGPWGANEALGIFETLDQQGNSNYIGAAFGGGIGFNGRSGNVTVRTWVDVANFHTNEGILPPAGPAVPLPEQVRPSLPGELPDAASVASPQIAPVEAPSIDPAAVPEPASVPTPAAVPGGLPAGQPATPPAPAQVGRVVRSFTRSTPGSQPQIITAAGVEITAPPARVPVTPAEAVLIGGRLLGGRGSTPPSTPAGMAAELGRLERKSELALDNLGPLEKLPDVIDAITDLVGLLDDFDAGGIYSIRPACGTDANGQPLPPIEVPIASGLGLQHAVVARLDAIAELIDHHKQLRQPICKGKPTGDPVTVTGVEVE